MKRLRDIPAQALAGLRNTLQRLLRLESNNKQRKYSRPSSWRLRFLRLSSVRNWQLRLADDTAYGASFFPVHSVVDGFYSEQGRDFVDLSDPEATYARQQANEAIRTLFLKTR
jgi:hypothetical protein